MLYTECDETDLEIAKTELNENEENKSDKIDELRDLCKASEKIGEICYDRYGVQFSLQ